MARRRVFIDVTPLRQSRDLRILLGGQLVSLLGTQLTAVAVPYQVYRLTGSSLDVGLVSLTQLIPLLICSLYSGTVIDATDRRKLLLRVEVLMGCCSAGLALNADQGARLWPLFVLPAVTAGLTAFDNPTRNAIVPNLVAPEHIATTSAMNQVLNQLGTIVGPALGGILLAGAGINFVYWIDVASFAVAVVAAWAISPQPPAEHATRPGLRSIAEGFRFIRGRPGIQGAYLIDINAMVFGMPRALFPAMAVNVFRGGATTVGLLYAAPGVGALAGALATGWVAHVRRQGLAVIVAVIVWGAAIVAFGLTGNLVLALLFLAIAGWADVISAVLRSTIIQLSVPDRLRGRLAAIQIGVVQGGPRLGDLEAGAVGNAFGNEVSVISGGLACIAGALVLARLLPGFRTVQVSADTAPGREPPPGTPPPPAPEPPSAPAPGVPGTPLPVAPMVGHQPPHHRDQRDQQAREHHEHLGLHDPRVLAIAATWSGVSCRLALLAAGTDRPIPQPVMPAASASQAYGDSGAATDIANRPPARMRKPPIIGSRYPVRRSARTASPATEIMPTARAVSSVPAPSGAMP